MHHEVIDEDAVDSEALQAQIDLSMSFAQNLISSWMEPHKFPTSSRRQNLEQELTEYMKRPPRLGVGAAIPEGTQSQTREVARLKGKLAGLKRPREEEDTTTPKTALDEEGDSRAGAIKKKARSDPFDVVHGQKKKKSKNAEVVTSAQATSSGSPLSETKKNKKPSGIVNSQPTVPNPPASAQESNADSSDEIERMLSEPNGTDVSPVTSIMTKETIFLTQKPSTIKSSPTNASSLNSSSTPPPNPSRKGSSSQEVVNASPSKTSGSRKSFPSDLLKGPLLNLTGPPPSDPESDCDPVTPSTSPKKKRKRRKKKKNHSLPSDTAETTNSSHGPVLA